MTSRLLTAAFALALALPLATHAEPLQLKPGDHVAIVGNVLADRLQFSGWLETYIQAKYPDAHLVFRNLSAAGDEVATWQRSKDFGTRDEWLQWTQADVIFAFYGFGEAQAGYDGISKFKADLDNFLKQTAKQNYSGKGAPRIVLFSPIAQERMSSPDFPDPSALNTNLQNYAAAMADVAKANNVLFVDLFAPSEKLFSEMQAKGQQATLNGHYLNDAAQKGLAPVMYQGLFGEAPPAGDLGKLNAAVLDKDWEWHTRYRTIDGYNVYGERSRLSYTGKLPDGTTTPKISNNEVMQREMHERDVMTANRDARIWAVAKGGDLQVKDDNLPPPIQVGTDLPGDRPDLLHTFLSGQDAISKMTVHSGMKVNLFADEKMFPDLIKPVQMAWDTKGRLWVSVWINYPERTPTGKRGDKILILEDTDGDGKADKCTVFLDDLNAPTGFQFYKDGVLVMQAPDVWFVKDTDGDGKADFKERILMGLDSADSHHTTNSMCLEPGGAVYLSDGVFHRSQVESATGVVRNTDAAVYRFEPNTGRFETYASYGFANPHGRVFDYWGNDIITDATGNASYFAAAFSGHVDYPAKHPTMNQFWARPSRPCAGTGIISSRHFPEEFQENFLNCNVISYQGIYRVGVKQDGSGLKGETLENLISSTDENFRPSQVNIGPDGALYVADWSNAIIGHMQHHLRDPNRDHDHGRIYRITYDGRPLLKAPKIDGAPIPALLDLLKLPEDGTRTLAKIELGKHDSNEVIAATKKWLGALDKSDKDYEHNRLEALWVHQWHNVVDTDLLKAVLTSPEPRARAAAVRILSYWRDRVPNALSLLKTAAADADPRVRLHAVRAASFFTGVPAVEVALTAAAQPTDYYLDYVLTETLRQLEPVWRKAISDGVPLFTGNAGGGMKILLGKLSTEEMLKLPRTPELLTAIVGRAGISETQRLEALNDIAQQHKSTVVAELLATLKPLAPSITPAGTELARILARQPAQDLRAVRSQLAEFVNPRTAADVRVAAIAALVTADGSFEPRWSEAAKSASEVTEMLEAVPRVADPALRLTVHEKSLAMLTNPPAEIAAEAKGGTIPNARFVRVELPRKGTLTLAEVQVFSGGKNIAPTGKARQSSTAFSGDAAHAIDGNTAGDFGSGSESHTAENEDHPWWEVDLGKDQPVDSVAVWNRTEQNGKYVKRLEGFTLTVLDAQRHEIFKKDRIPAPQENTSISVKSTGVATFQRAAIHAAVASGGDPAPVFAALCKLIEKGEEVTASAHGIRALPRTGWKAQAAAPAANAIVTWGRKLTPAERAIPENVATIQLAVDLAGLLPADQAAGLRKDLKDLRVAVFVVNTVREQMRYDTPRIVVETGKPFQVIFQNGDVMPHNFVVVKGGTREKVGTAAMTMPPTKLDGEGRAYIPQTTDIIGASKLIEPGQTDKLNLIAPNEEGENEYVCTFPGHWMIMWGKLIVVKDVDAYLQAHPEPAPAGGGGVGTVQ